MGFFAYNGESFAFALNLGFIFAGHDGPEGANLATEVPLAKGHHAILAGASFFLGNPKFLGSLKYTLNYYLGGVTSYVTKYIPPAPGQPPSPLIATNGSFHPYQIHKLNIKFSLKVLTDLAFNFYFRQKWLQLPYLYEKGQVFSYHYRDYLDYSSLGISVKYSFNENFGLELGYFLKVVDSKKDDPFFAIDSADEGPSISFIGYVF